VKYFSMFTGVGGFEYGIEKAFENIRSESSIQGGWNEDIRSTQDLQPRGNFTCIEKPSFECVGYSEIDKYANQVMRYRYPELKNYEDATKIEPSELPDFDMLCGGFPCQTFSIAGKRRGFQDTRGTLFFEIARILETKRSKLVWLENVKGLLNHDKGQTFRVIIQTLEELGYDVQWMVLNSKFFGVPQNRERVFIIGSIREEPRPKILPFRENAGEISGVYDTQDSKPVGQPLNNWSPIITYTYRAFDGSSKEDGRAIREHKAPNESSAMTSQMGMGGNNVPMVLGYTNPNEPHQSGTVVSDEGITPALYAQQYKSPLQVQTVGQLRRLTPRECERLQGFPDDWTKYGIDEKGNKVEISDTQRYKMMGNAVTTKVITAIASKLVNEIKK